MHTLNDAEGKKVIRVLIVEDSEVFAQGLEMALEANGFTIAGIAKNQVEALTLICRVQPTVVIVDVRIPASAGERADYRYGLATINALRAKIPELPILAMSMIPETNWAVEAVQVGASGFIDKDAESEKIVNALHTVVQGGVELTAEQLSEALMPRATALEDLTSREREVLRALAAGKSNKEIAALLGISVRTIDSHVSNILDKLGVGTRKQAVVEARRRRLI